MSDSLKEKLLELAKHWEEMAYLVLKSPTSTFETRAQATGWLNCTNELRKALANENVAQEGTKPL
jgi:hypothetical protein